MFLHWSGPSIQLDNVYDYYIVGSPTFNSTFKKFGTHSLQVSGVNQQNGVYYVPPTSLALGTHWTMEGWFYAVDPGTGNYGDFEVFMVETDQGYEFGFDGNHNATYTDWFWRTGNAETIDKLSTPYGYWRHLALVRNGDQFLAYYDGQQLNGPDEFYLTGDINRIIVGYAYDGETYGGFNGYIDELRISTVARYTDTTSITVPTSAFSLDADTLFLRHFDNSYT